MVAVAEQLIEHDSYGEQVRRYVPAGEVGVRRLVGRGAGDGVNHIVYARCDVEVKKLGPLAREDDVQRFDVAMDESFVAQLHQLRVFGFG